MTISIIVAVADNNAIGLNNQLLWHISEDLKRFKSLTSGHHIIMGRKTFESIGKPLPNRTNIVISRNPNFKPEGCIVVCSLDEALVIARNEQEVFIIGGGEIYKQVLPLTDRIYLTRVHGSFPADTFFPELELMDWEVESTQKGKPAESDELHYTFINYTKKR